MTGAVSSHAPVSGGGAPGVSLGVWTSMPSAVTELMGNTSYRGILTGSGTFSGVTVRITVGCITPSNTMGAQLQLQYALYDLNLGVTTGFQNVGGPAFIDGSTQSGQCNPGGGQPMVAGSSGTLNASAGYVFRAMGSGGGGVGDNPRFSSVSVSVTLPEGPIYLPVVTSVSTTVLSFRVFAIVPSSASLTVYWTATNVSSGGKCGVSGTSTNHCWEAGTQTCAFSGGLFCSNTVTFATAFTGTVIPGITTKIYAQTTFASPGGSISLLSAQTLTV